MKVKFRHLLLVTTALAVSPAWAQADANRIASIKDQVSAGIEARAKLAQEMNDTLFSFGELAFHEVETSNYITKILEDNGFTIERGVAGLPTGWTARWGSGAPAIGLGSDIDGLPTTSQYPGVAYRKPMVEGAQDTAKGIIPGRQ